MKYVPTKQNEDVVEDRIRQRKRFQMMQTLRDYS